jgi:hypothetical protein
MVSNFDNFMIESIHNFVKKDIQSIMLLDTKYVCRIIDHFHLSSKVTFILDCLLSWRFEMKLNIFKSKIHSKFNYKRGVDKL